jgi:predicted nucleotidyltransferase
MTDSHIIVSLNEIIRRIINITNPLKIILFGSAARGHMCPNSDLDLLVVMPSPVHRRKTAQKIYQELIGVDKAADIVVVTEEDIERFKDDYGLIIRPALKDGKIIYAR